MAGNDAIRANARVSWHVPIEPLWRHRGSCLFVTHPCTCQRRTPSRRRWRSHCTRGRRRTMDNHRKSRGWFECRCTDGGEGERVKQVTIQSKWQKVVSSPHLKHAQLPRHRAIGICATIRCFEVKRRIGRRDGCLPLLLLLLLRTRVTVIDIAIPTRRDAATTSEATRRQRRRVADGETGLGRRFGRR